MNWNPSDLNNLIITFFNGQRSVSSSIDRNQKGRIRSEGSGRSKEERYRMQTQTAHRTQKIKRDRVSIHHYLEKIEEKSNFTKIYSRNTTIGTNDQLWETTKFRIFLEILKERDKLKM